MDLSSFREFERNCDGSTPQPYCSTPKSRKIKSPAPGIYVPHYPAKNYPCGLKEPSVCLSMAGGSPFYSRRRNPDGAKNDTNRSRCSVSKSNCATDFNKQPKHFRSRSADWDTRITSNIGQNCHQEVYNHEFQGREWNKNQFAESGNAVST